MEKEAFNEDRHGLNFEYIGGLMKDGCKCKIFSVKRSGFDEEDIKELEKKINKWLTANWPIDLISVSTTPPNEHSSIWAIIIFYSKNLSE